MCQVKAWIESDLLCVSLGGGVALYYPCVGGIDIEGVHYASRIISALNADAMCKRCCGSVLSAHEIILDQARMLGIETYSAL